MYSNFIKLITRVEGSNPSPATNLSIIRRVLQVSLFGFYLTVAEVRLPLIKLIERESLGERSQRLSSSRCGGV